MTGYDALAVDTFDFHHSMLVDEIRTASFLDAIVETVEDGDVVVDIGSGTGVLALFAAKAGASRVYAIEREPVINTAREIAAHNEMLDRIVFIEGSSLDVEIPERVDVLISETIGNIGFDEGIITWVADAKERFLKPDAAIVPRRIDVVACLASVPRDYRPVERWSEPLMTLDFAPLSRIALNNVLWTDLSPAAIETVPNSGSTASLDPPSYLVPTSRQSRRRCLARFTRRRSTMRLSTGLGSGSSRILRGASMSRTHRQTHYRAGNRVFCPSANRST